MEDVDPELDGKKTCSFRNPSNLEDSPETEKKHLPSLEWRSDQLGTIGGI